MITTLEIEPVDSTQSKLRRAATRYVNLQPLHDTSLPKVFCRSVPRRNTAHGHGMNCHRIAGRTRNTLHRLAMTPHGSTVEFLDRSEFPCFPPTRNCSNCAEFTPLPWQEQTSIQLSPSNTAEHCRYVTAKHATCRNRTISALALAFTIAVWSVLISAFPFM